MNFYSKIVLICHFLFLVYFVSFGQGASNFIKLDKSFLGNSNIVQDKHGFILISGSDGLYKYDGYEFDLISYKSIFGKNFTRDRDFLLVKDNNDYLWVSSLKGELTKIGVDDGTNISYKEKLTYNKVPLQITAIAPHNKNVWLGSVSGVLFKHNFLTSKIDSITTLPKIKGSTQKIESIAFTRSNKIWISTGAGNIYNYSLSTNKLKKVRGLLNNSIQNIILTSDKIGHLWIATESQGLFNYNPKRESVIKQYNYKHHLFTSIFCDNSGVIWAGTDGAGLYRINPKNQKITIFKEEESNKFSISNNTITKINEDSKGNIWIVLKKGIINVLPKVNNKIKYYNGLETNNPTTVLSILKSSEGSLWIGTDGKGLNRVFPDGTKKQYAFNKKNKYLFEGKFIQQLEEDAKGNIWIGTYQNGLWVFNPNLNTFNKINTTSSNGTYSSDIRLLFRDSKNRIWVASSVAFNVFSDNQELLATYDYNTHGLFGIISMSACEDERGTLWFGMNPSRLYSFNEDLSDLNNSYFTNHNYYIKKKEDSRNYNVLSLVPDNNGNIWILSTSGILIKYDLINNSFESFAEKDKFKNISISSILFEDTNNLWFSSSNGVHQYNFASDVLKSYYRTDGFHNNSFTRRSSYKDTNGKLYFGGEDGVDSFFPSELDKKETFAKLYITNIEVLNKPAGVIIGNQVKKGIENLNELKLNYNQSSFSFQFSAIDNILNPNYQYAYRLKGFDKDWIIPRKERVASYTNIPFGNYSFEVKASSKKGEWNIEPKTIDIHIKAPWWYSPLAFTFYLIFILLLVYATVKWLRLKNKLLKEIWENNKEKELYAVKMNFFAKMSHEIQTPLTLILSPIKDMLERARANKNELLSNRLLMIYNNTNRLSRIANELMIVRNKELGKLRIFATKNNLIKDLKKIAISFSEQARFKNIHFIQKYPESEINIWYDTDKIEHIIYNLLSNAFKFTPRGGVVTLKVDLNSTEEFVKISILDSGSGIPEEELDNIFKLFYRSNLGKQTRGVGIGLALTKELIALHHGEINVTSSREFGSCFSIKLPTDENVYSKNEKIFVENSSDISNSLNLDFKELEKEYIIKHNNNLSEKLYTLLIVEDNIEMQMFLRDVLGDSYNLLIAENGKEGIDLAKKNNPDLIISDIMMPVMNGLEMCKILLKKKSTSHIPIILLTAKNKSTSKIKALKLGAVEYIKKPFNFYELILKINNILNTKEKILSKYKTDLINSPEDITTPSKDDTFMENLVRELNIQIENPDFRLENLSESLNMSYSVIYRKCQDITGKTLVEFVRSLKLKKAALLIIQHGYNISEASYMVGYKDAKYFTKCFKEEFGLPPITFKREAKLIGIDEFLNKYNIHTK